MFLEKEEQPGSEDDARSRSSSLDSHEPANDAEEPQPTPPEAQPHARPPLPPRKRVSPSSSLSRSSAPLAGCATSNLSPDDTITDCCSHVNGQTRLPTSIVTRRSEDTQASRLAKSLSTAYLLANSSSLSPDPVACNSDGGVPLGVATMPHIPTVTTANDLPALQAWAPAHTHTHTQAALSPGLSTPLAAVILNPPGAAAPTAAAAGPTAAAAAAAAATSTGAMTPGSAGPQVALPHTANLHGVAGAAASGLSTTSAGTMPLPPYAHTRTVMGHSLSAGEEALQSLAAYVAAETQPAEKTPTADVVWGQTERERVYNFLLYVPYQLERLIWFGSLLLVDSFLGVFTLLPLRCALALAQLARGAAGALIPSWLRPRCPTASATPPLGDGGAAGPGAPERRHLSFSTAASFVSATSAASRVGSITEPPAASGPSLTAPSFTGSAASATATAAASAAAAAATAAAADPRVASSGPRLGGSSGPSHSPARLSGSQLYDMVCLAILFLATAALRAVRPGSIYYWLKDITSEFLKMSVLSTAFDMLDKILSNFGNDVLEALSGTCTQWLEGKKRMWQLASDATVAGGIVTLHALTLMCQALIVAVALNSSRNGLVALLIANNFVEIKSTVFKKWDSTRIWALVCADAVERFHLLVVLSFVVVEEMDSAASWSPPPDYLRVCGLMVAAEVVIDVIKHAVLGKFNEVRPGLYREFHQDLCAKALAAQSHSAPRLLNFHHLAPAALAMRIAVTLFWLRVETRAQVWPRLAIVAVLYGVMCGVKLLFGYCIKVLAHYHNRYYNRKYGVKPYVVRPTPTRVGGGGAAGAPAGGLGWPAASAPLPHAAGAAAAAAAVQSPLGLTLPSPVAHAAPASPVPLQLQLQAAAAGLGQGQGQGGAATSTMATATAAAGTGLTAAILASLSGRGVGVGAGPGHAKLD
ncbi:hypothetical protein PLESTB_001244300 [Pleodorina starrii]|uniref:Eukaryotic membrane protein family-domain-containing protein n=1 Tax=Pleodorina starrii TaxID=330485 RepID=A0A9W6BSE0_9CHLO|nr:hypothetical protein PLESTM_000215500 [Pleodorina starrii]GLC57596.1 hypothetical protein PLESTB_001244300 [Pleodorina starrii]GLC63266.1 hypothetical protein PLESTF_000018100 [Pleodorina starrii]